MDRKIINLENSQIIEIGSGLPVIGVVGLCHGDEKCGRIVLDELAESLEPLCKVKLIYANLKAEKEGKRHVDSDLNRVFFGSLIGDLENRTAFALTPHLKECDYVLDIHSTPYPTTPFAISTIDNEEFDRLSEFTGLENYVIMVGSMASGKSLIDYVNYNGKGISFESGINGSEKTIQVAREVTRNFLANMGAIEGKKFCSKPKKFLGFSKVKIESPNQSFPSGTITYGEDVISVYSNSFKPYDTIKNFELLKAGTAFGRDEQKEYSLEHDCYPCLYSTRMTGGVVFVVTNKEEQKNQNI